MNNKKNSGMKNSLYYIIVFLSMIMIVYFFFGQGGDQSPTINYSTFYQQLKDGEVKEFSVQPANGVYNITGEYSEEQNLCHHRPLRLWENDPALYHGRASFP